MLRQVILRSSASVANSESAAVSSSTNVSRVSVCLWVDTVIDQLSVNELHLGDELLLNNFERLDLSSLVTSKTDALNPSSLPLG